MEHFGTFSTFHGTFWNIVGVSWNILEHLQAAGPKKCGEAAIGKTVQRSYFFRSAAQNAKCIGRLRLLRFLAATTGVSIVVTLMILLLLMGAVFASDVRRRAIALVDRCKGLLPGLHWFSRSLISQRALAMLL